MDFYKEGDKSKAICGHCKKIVPTTFKVRRANLKDGNATLVVPDVLIAACDECDKIAGVPQQSFAAVAEVRKKAEKASLDVRLARHHLDVLNNVLEKLGIRATPDLRSHLLRYYIASIDLKNLKYLTENLDSELLQGSYAKGNRLSIKINEDLKASIKAVLDKSKLTKTELVESVIVEVKDDVLDRPDKAKIEELKRSLLASA
ncbi:MAG: hypothetical protein J0L82_19255 [Deltaproteobacteria bacterium]|jgi:hypothetical protein|nr:hypothetical protein [Deltaproteobacteria bacterium]